MEDTPRGQAQRWGIELAAAKKELEGWHKSGEKVVARFLDEREDSTARRGTRWNLFWTNITTQRALLYGRTPQVSVERRFADPQDDAARVAGEMLERALNSDIEKDSDTFAQALQYALDDRLLPGLGVVRLRYVPTTETVEAKEAILGPDGKELAPEVPEAEVLAYECVETDYVHWRDILWSPARVWHEVRWLAFRTELSRKQVVERFGNDKAKLVPFTSPKSDRDADDARKATPWSRADVWEIWCKESKSVYWYCEGAAEVLDEQEDKLGLDAFFPCPRPMFANVTTSKLRPRPDYKLAEDIYEEINEVCTRITVLERAVVVRGVYAKESGEVRSLLNEACQNDLVPVQNWNAFAEKGGLKGVVDWLPIDMVVNALGVLRDYRRELMDALYQITGMSDIMRGQASEVGATATEQSIKAKFGSVRMQALQDEFARFATDAQRLKAEIISKHFQPKTLVKASNVGHTPDAALVPAALDLIFGPVGEDGERNREAARFAQYRVQVKPEAVSMQDFASIRSERSEVFGTLAQFMQAAMPLAQAMPGSMPHLIRMMQWVVAGLRGASQIEGVLDQAAAQAEQAQQQAAQNPQGQQPDPKLLSQQMKGQQDLAKIQAETQARLVEIKAETEAAAQQEQTQMVMNTREAAMKAQIGAAQRAQQPQSVGGRRP